mmetsp:Transcript_29494/g.66771  ORF Transcript_29494/g.66771 Transcript_29494/m.66771 type:complete len:87 (-) Transcript_29494:744-1004(-)
MYHQALQLLTKNRRPDATTAADIGSYQVVLDTLSTLSIITNAGIVGVCSFSLYFYFPTMTDVSSPSRSQLFTQLLNRSIACGRQPS